MKFVWFRYKDSIPTSEQTHNFSVIRSNRMVFW